MFRAAILSPEIFEQKVVIMKTKKTPALYATFIIASGIFWGTIGLFTKMLDAAGVGTFNSVSIRSTVTMLFLGLLLLISNPKAFRINLRHVPIFALCGVLSLTINNSCYFYSIKLSGMATAAVLLYTAPIFVMIMSMVFFKEKLTAKKVVCLVLTFVGCIFVSMTETVASFSWVGIVCGLISGFCYALYTMISKILMENYSPLTTAFYIFVFASLSSFVIANPVETVRLVAQTDTLIWALGLGVVSSALPYLLYNMGLVGLVPSKAAIIATVEPVVAAVIDVLFFKSTEALVFKVMGVMLVVGAIIFMNVGKKYEKSE